jgi:hypothetical protein
MSTESAPDQPPQPETPPRSRRKPRPGPRPTTSPAQVAANRLNALKSTGPITPDGKATSSRNSTKHGFCSLVTHVPGEDPDGFDARFASFDATLNPADDPVAAYTVALLVRQTQNLDRLHVARTARAAKLVRDAAKDRATARGRDVEAALRLFATDPDAARRRLLETPEGCDALIKEWTRLRAPLGEPAAWDHADGVLAHVLLGDYTVNKQSAPGFLATPTAWVTEHREVQRRLTVNKRAWVHPRDKYLYEGDKTSDENRIDQLLEASRSGVNWLRSVVDAQVDGIRQHRMDLVAEDVRDLDEAPLRARLDASEEGRLLHRYEQEAYRGYFRTLAVLRGGLSAWKKEIQVDVDKQVAPELPVESGPPAAPPPAPVVPRNEANFGGRTHKLGLIPMATEEGVCTIDVAATPPIDRPDRK